MWRLHLFIFLRRSPTNFFLNKLKSKIFSLKTQIKFDFYYVLLVLKYGYSIVTTERVFFIDKF